MSLGGGRAGGEENKNKRRRRSGKREKQTYLSECFVHMQPFITIGDIVHGHNIFFINPFDKWHKIKCAIEVEFIGLMPVVQM